MAAMLHGVELYFAFGLALYALLCVPRLLVGE